MTDWEEAVARALDALDPGDVVTYGEVAAQAGRPGAARAVGRYLASSDGSHPWWRVVTTDGRLVPGIEREHARRLRAEGVDVVGDRVRVDRRRPGTGGGADTATEGAAT
jgi:methylated-DNA-protein-cysteine methyltransferase related protein